MTAYEIAKLFEPDAKPVKVRIDAVGGGVTYYGWTSHGDADGALNEWYIVKEVVAAPATTLSLPVSASGEEIEGQVHVWDDRATFTYGS